MRFHQVVGNEGVQIPLPIIQQYGLKPGAGVVFELEANGIRVLPAAIKKEEIENIALGTLLRSLGDAVTVDVTPVDHGWCASVYGVGLDERLGELVYSATGEALASRSTPIELMRQKVLEVVGNS